MRQDIYDTGLRRVLEYLCEKRYRRWIASAVLFLLVFSVLEFPSRFTVALLLSLVSAVGWFDIDEVFTSFRMSLLAFHIIRLIPPLTITLLIFWRLRKIYRNY